MRDHGFAIQANSMTFPLKKRKPKKLIFSAERPDLVVAASGGGGGVVAETVGGVVAETVRVADSLQTTSLTAFDGLCVG